MLSIKSIKKEHIRQSLISGAMVLINIKDKIMNLNFKRYLIVYFL